MKKDGYLSGEAGSGGKGPRGQGWSYDEIEACLALAKSGDMDKMGELILMLEPLIKRQVRHYFGVLDEDYVQMGRIRVFELVLRFDPGFTDVLFLGYIKRFLGCYFWDLKKQSLRSSELVDGFVDMEELSELATYEDQGFLKVELDDLLACLSEDERFVIRNNVMEGLSLFRLAQAMGKSYDQVKYIKQKALTRLRAKG